MVKEKVAPAPYIREKYIVETQVRRGGSALALVLSLALAPAPPPATLNGPLLTTGQER